MRIIALATTTLMALSLSPAAAHAEGSWCAQYSGRAGGSNCGFHSFAQCRATVSGVVICQPNPFRAYDATRAPRRRTYRREH